MVNTGKDKEKTAMEKQEKTTRASGDPLVGRSINRETDRVQTRTSIRSSTSSSQRVVRQESVKTEKPSTMKKTETKAPKRSIFHKKDQKMNLYSSLIYRSRAKKEAKARKNAEELAKLPKDPVKRFFARLHPKRVFRFIFSKKGLFFFLKSAAVLFLISVIAIGGLFLYYKKDLDEIRLDQMKVSGTVNTYLDRNGQLLWEDKGDGEYRLVADGENIATYMRQSCHRGERILYSSRCLLLRSCPCRYFYSHWSRCPGWFYSNPAAYQTSLFLG